MLEHVFVYGTLRPPQPDTSVDDSRYYPQIAQFVKSSEDAYLNKGFMFDLGSYPAVILGTDTIKGNLLTVTSKALTIMDTIEGHPKFYKRARVEVQTSAGSIKAWIYWAPKGMTLGKPRITNGDWLYRAENTVQLDPPPDESQIDPTLRALIQRFAQAECSWLSSIRPDTRAHSAPVWHGWFKGRVYVITTANAVKTANIKENPSVVITHPDPMNALIIEGWATLVPAMRTQLQPLFKEKYDWDLNTDGVYETIIEITPTRLIAWGEFGEGRWDGVNIMQVWLM